MTPLSGDAMPPVVWFDASSSSSSHRVFPVSTTLSRVAGNRGSILAHPSLSRSLVSVSWRWYLGCNTSTAWIIGYSTIIGRHDAGAMPLCHSADTRDGQRDV